MRLRFVHFECLLVLAFAGCTDDVIIPDKKDLPKVGSGLRFCVRAILCGRMRVWI